MGHAIPKIEWKSDVETCTSVNGSDTLTLVNTSLIEVGMIAEGTGIPANTTVLAKTSATVQLSNLATISAFNDIEFLYRISLDYPPIEENGEEQNAYDHTSASLSGIAQTSVDFIEGTRALTFSHLSQSLYLQFKTFFETYAYISQSFKYYEDKSLPDFIEYELKDLKFKPKKIGSRGTDYVWLIPFNFRRVIL